MKIPPSIQPWEIRYERLWKKLCNARKQIEILNKEVAELSEENLALREPQTPPWVKPNLSHKKKRRKKPGPKAGHRAFVRTLPNESQINEEVTLSIKKCPSCDIDLPGPASWHTHVQIDIAEARRIWITRYYVGYPYCNQCHKLVPILPPDRKGMLPYCKYGPKLHAVVTYWKFGMGLSLGKIRWQLQDELGLKISTGQISEMLANSAKKLEILYTNIRLMLRQQHHLYVDETGWRNSGDNFWLWSFSNEDYSYYRIEKRRSHKVVRNTLGTRFYGILISDFFSAYNEIHCLKQKCWAHLLRSTKKLTTDYPDNPEILSFHKKMKSFFRRGVKLKSAYQNGASIRHRYLQLKGETKNFIRQKFRNPNLMRLRKRLKRHLNSIYIFIKHSVDPTNNSAEREIRPAVLMRKDQFSNRSLKGSHTQEILMTVIRTCFKQNINYLELATHLIATF